ncbi:hypothetical protein TVAG_504180, partial [Trichomonas vaginalis G3]
MNSTIVSLSISSISQSPLIFHGIGSLKRCDKFSSIKATKFANSFFRSSNTNAEFINSAFTKFLNTPVKISTLKYSSEFFHTTEKIKDETTAIFRNCIFRKCSKKKGLGGGISYQNDDGQILISDCCFFKCSSGSCGAFFIRSKIHDIKSTCIKKCHALLSDIMFRITGPKYPSINDIVIEPSKIEQISCSLNGPLNISDVTGLMLFYHIIVDISNSNVSKSYPVKERGAIESQYAEFFRFSFIHFENNQGPGLIFLDSNKGDSEIAYCNFIENNPGTSLKLFEIHTKKTHISNCVIQNIVNINELVEMITPKAAVFVSCVFDLSESKIGSLNLTNAFKNCIYKEKSPALNKIISLNEKF